LYQAFKLLILVDSNNVFSQQAINVLKNIKYASLILIGFIAIAEIFIHLFAGGDDPAGPTMLGFIVSIAVAVVATAASIFQKILRNAVDLKSENDLTV
jgi:O-antigen/teichoic acid export membrane protein